MLKKSLFILILFLLKNTIAVCQNSSLQIEVRDEKTNEIIPFASVTVNTDTGFVKGAVTDFDGGVTIADLSAGKYTLEVIYIGCKKNLREVTVEAGKAEKVKVKMQSAAIELSVCEILVDDSLDIIICGPVCTYHSVCNKCCLFGFADIDKTDSIKEELKAIAEPKFKCYPNPTAGVVFVEPTEHARELLVMDMTGRVIQQQVINEEQRITFDFSSYAPGVYSITCINGDKLYTERIVVAY